MERALYRYSDDAVCSVEGCDRRPAARGMCNKHWTRWRKYGRADILKHASWIDPDNKVCTFSGCNQKAHSYGYCRAHRRYTAKQKIIEHYGGKCECCGESTYEFLSIDHINGDGHKHLVNGRKLGGFNLYNYLITHNFECEFDLRLLCHNCNQSLGIYGFCPHGGLTESSII